MCAYCFIGDHAFKYDPPWDHMTSLTGVPSSPFIPAKVTSDPIVPWTLERLKEYLDILKEVKALEDQLQCPCEPNKANYIKMFQERIAMMEGPGSFFIPADTASLQTIDFTGGSSSPDLNVTSTSRGVCHCTACQPAGQINVTGKITAFFPNYDVEEFQKREDERIAWMKAQFPNGGL